MAQPANTVSTNDMIGIREDLSDVIYNVSPTDTVVLSMAPHGGATQSTHEWQTDALAAAAANAVIEGDDATTDAHSPTTRLNNRLQISDKVARVSGTGRAVTTAGREDELGYESMKKAKELKLDMEKAICDNKAKVAGNDTLASELAGIPTYIVTNIDEAGDATTATGDGSDAHTDGTPRAFTEDMVKGVMKLCYDNGGEPSVLMTGSFNRQIASTFSANGTNVQKAEDPTLHKTFTVYESDFGDLKIIPNRLMEARTAILLDPKMLSIDFLPGRNMSQVDLAKTGDSDRRQVLSEYTVKVNNGLAHGIINDLTVA